MLRKQVQFGQSDQIEENWLEQLKIENSASGHKPKCSRWILDLTLRPYSAVSV